MKHLSENFNKISTTFLGKIYLLIDYCRVNKNGESVEISSENSEKIRWTFMSYDRFIAVQKYDCRIDF